MRTIIDELSRMTPEAFGSAQEQMRRFVGNIITVESVGIDRRGNVRLNVLVDEARADNTVFTTARDPQFDFSPLDRHVNHRSRLAPLQLRREITVDVAGPPTFETLERDHERLRQMAAMRWDDYPQRTIGGAILRDIARMEDVFWCPVAPRVIAERNVGGFTAYANRSIARCLARVEEIKPDWARRVDADKLNIRSPRWCFLAQVFSEDNWEGYRSPYHYAINTYFPEGAQGFAVCCKIDGIIFGAYHYGLSPEEQFNILTELWKGVVLKAQKSLIARPRRIIDTHVFGLADLRPPSQLRNNLRGMVVSTGSHT